MRMQLVERVREGAVKDHDEGKTRKIRVDDLERLQHQLRRATERNMKSFDEGFGAAVLMVSRGADLEQLRNACGVVAVEWQDTAPIESVSWDEEKTEECLMTFAI